MTPLEQRAQDLEHDGPQPLRLSGWEGAPTKFSDCEGSELM